MRSMVVWFQRLLLCIALALAACAAAIADPLPSWNDGAAKQSIIAFVDAVTTPGQDYVVPEERIAVFDNDGTLWCEQPGHHQELDRRRHES